MSEILVESISDTEAIFERPGPTANIFAHVHRAALRTEDDWLPCCEKATLDEIRNSCERYRRWD
jgi:hypothetical protein